MWFAIGAGVSIVAFLIYQTIKPSLQRKRAVQSALDNAAAAVRAQPDDVGPKLALARVYTELASRPDDARQLLEPIVTADATHWHGDEKPTRILLAEAHVGLGDLPRAISILEEFVASIPDFDTAGDKERKWRLETHKVDSEQRIRSLKKGDLHVHGPEQWGDQAP